MIREDRLTDTFMTLLKQESPSLEELPLAQWLTAHLRERGFTVRMDGAAEATGGNCGNLIAHLPGNREMEPLCFAAHLDQIPPCRNIKAHIDGNLIRTDGTTTLGGDDKGGIAAILEAVEHVLEEGADHPPLYLLFTVAEETGLLGAKYLAPELLPVTSMVILDAAGPAGILAYKAPALSSVRMTFKGRKAHAGIEPEKGINAIQVAGTAIAGMHTGRMDSETTVNLGIIGGGTATNVVPDEVVLKAEIRSHAMEKLEAELRHMEACCQAAAQKYETRAEFRSELDFPAFELPRDAHVYQLAEESFRKVGLKAMPVVTGGGSDANVLSAKGYQCVIISVGMDKVHTVEETLSIPDLKATVHALVLMMSGGRG